MIQIESERRVGIEKADSVIRIRFFYSHETPGIRTPDNLIKSQVLYHLS